MAKWNVSVMVTGYVEMEIEADSYEEACAEAIDTANEEMIDEWDYDIDYCEQEDD